MTRIREARQSHGWSQSRLIRALTEAAARDGYALPDQGSLRVMVSRWENGHVTPDDTYRRYLCVALGRSERELGLSTSRDMRSLLTVELPRPAGLPQHIGPELLGFLTRTLDEYADADSALGSLIVLPVAEQQATTVTALAARTTPLTDGQSYGWPPATRSCADGLTKTPGTSSAHKTGPTERSNTPRSLATPER
jgi:transcriptional regulator with XRE-family HTH domain